MTRLAVWRSPAGQPWWARPVLLVVAVVAGLAYGWHMGSSIEIFYAAAARSMSMSWHDFLYGAFDPAGTVTVDKLPGALWLQALSGRLFGVHAWSIDLPQVLEGALTVLVLFRPVRRLAGPVAGIVAAAVLAVSPATVALDRGNISDTLLVLLLVLAADSLVDALITGRGRSVALAGVWVGLAFQTKMMEAWFVVPALVLAYLVASAATLRERSLRLAGMVGVVVAVSLCWMVLVTLTPTSHRPYVDGSEHNSVFEQVFRYNGFGRVGSLSPNEQMGRTLGITYFTVPPPAPAWNRVLTGPYGRDAAWLLPASLVVVVAGLAARRRTPRTDHVRAGIILWGTWLIVFGVAFSASPTINAYYLAALSPPVAGLLGIGSVLAWEGRRGIAVRMTVVGVVLVTAGYWVWLLPDAGTGLPAWLRPAVPVLGVLAAAAVGATLVRRAARLTVTAATAAAAALLIVPVVASLSVVTNTLGAFDTPFQPARTTLITRALFGALGTPSTLPRVEAARMGAPDLMATQTSVLAAAFIYATGEEVLPIGGFTGSVPEPTVAQLASLVAAGDFHLVITGPASTDPRIAWIAGHCLRIPGVTPGLGVYYCTPQA